MADGPCLNCINRKLNCHSTCEKYITWKEEKNKVKDAIKKKKVEEGIINQVQIGSSIRHGKRRKKR